jgi:uncharacterized protein with PQ loop repeat
MHHAKKSATPPETKAQKLTDQLIYCVAIVGPFTAAPQIWEIWVTDKSAAGVSFMTWSLFLLMSLIWLSYGVVRKELPIIISNGLWCIMELIVILGALHYRDDWL